MLTNTDELFEKTIEELRKLNDRLDKTDGNVESCTELTESMQNMLKDHRKRLHDAENRTTNLGLRTEDKLAKLNERIRGTYTYTQKLEDRFDALESRLKCLTILANTQASYSTRLHKLECQAGFVKGFKLQCEAPTKPKPTPKKPGEVWQDKSGVNWQVTQIKHPFAWLTNSNTHETKRLLTKSIRKHYTLANGGNGV